VGMLAVSLSWPPLPSSRRAVPAWPSRRAARHRGASPALPIAVPRAMTPMACAGKSASAAAETSREVTRAARTRLRLLPRSRPHAILKKS